MGRHKTHLNRTTNAIGPAIMEFYEKNPNVKFYACELLAIVLDKCGPRSPETPNRVLRSLRQRGFLNYEVLDYQKSLFQFLPLESIQSKQLELFHE